MTRNFISILHLTDLHLFQTPNQLFKGVDTRASFLQVIQHIQQYSNEVDAIVLTGDLAHDGETATYEYIAYALQVFDIPVYCSFGNHDNPNNAPYPLANLRTENHCLWQHWQMILLDSNHNSQTDNYEGEVSSAELQRLKQLIAEHPKHWTLIGIHHNLPQHEERGVAFEVRNHQQVMQEFQQHPTIRVVLSGHVHQEFVIVENPICYLSTPSTGYQSLSRTGKITGDVPGYRWLKLYDNGRFDTDVRRIHLIP